MEPFRDQEASKPGNLGQSKEEMPISATATDCESQFTKCILFLSSTGEREHEIIMQKLKKRFLEWAAYLGVFAWMNESLDQRLKHHPQWRDLIISVLGMLNMNLLHITVDPSESTTDESSGESSDEEFDLRKIALEGIQKSINELDRLAIRIRLPSYSSLDARVNAFASRKPAEISSFEVKAIIAVRWLYPNASENLRGYSSELMTHRYTKLLYWHSQEKKLRKDRRLDKKPQDDSIQRGKGRRFLLLKNHRHNPQP
ncbi:hypothetical protein TrVFT333_009590 [Trichoderma virens FT-333]|nr:hypothetical protein TrVFT333_009590 [Trichoderma virens FT-333]